MPPPFRRPSYALLWRLISHSTRDVARRNMCAGLNVHLDLGLVRLGVALLRKCFDVPVALPVKLVEHESLARLAIPRRPFTFPHRH